jgi:hypothetical protein
MTLALSLFGIEKAPLNTDPALVGGSMMGAGGAYVLVMYLINVCVLYILSAIIAKEEIGLREVLYVVVLAEMFGFLVNEAAADALGILAIPPILIMTVLLLIRITGVRASKAATITGVYYLFHATSAVFIRTIWVSRQ